jgi:hypothetical protein
MEDGREASSVGLEDAGRPMAKRAVAFSRIVFGSVAFDVRRESWPLEVGTLVGVVRAAAAAEAPLADGREDGTPAMGQLTLRPADLAAIVLVQRKLNSHCS